MRLLYMSVISLLISCATAGNYSLKDQPVHGKIGGKNWIMKSGEAGLECMDNRMYSYYCKAADDKKPSLSFHAPKKEGFYEIGPVCGASLSDNTKNISSIASKGFVEILEINRTKGFVKGKIYAYFDENNRVSGSFTVKLVHP